MFRNSTRIENEIYAEDIKYMFSKYEVYTTAQSLYCYPNTNVLKNKLNIHDQEVLKRAEEAITAVKQLDFRHS